MKNHCLRNVRHNCNYNIIIIEFRLGQPLMLGTCTTLMIHSVFNKLIKQLNLREYHLQQKQEHGNLQPPIEYIYICIYRNQKIKYSFIHVLILNLIIGVIIECLGYILPILLIHYLLGIGSNRISYLTKSGTQASNSYS